MKFFSSVLPGIGVELLYNGRWCETFFYRIQYCSTITWRYLAYYWDS